MTRFARVKKSARAEKTEATPWSSLSKICKPESTSAEEAEISKTQHDLDSEASKNVRKNKFKNSSREGGSVEAPQSSRNNAFNEMSRKLDSCDQTLEDVKELVTDYVRKGLVSRADAGKVVKRWKNSERRRIGRQLSKSAKAACYLCRKAGHVYSECPERDEVNMGVGVCYKCGSLEHGSAKCPRKNVVGYPYAFCFICKRQGHISRECEQNANGIYPDGGSCNLCGSQDHLKKDCPDLNLKKNQKNKKGSKKFFKVLFYYYYFMLIFSCNFWNDLSPFLESDIWRHFLTYFLLIGTVALVGDNMVGGDEEVLIPDLPSNQQKLKRKEKMIRF
uniref:CCHC-type domain-containing protein n=1 Tax=Syphacia muris TaxID=451379 RepID=A0A0N5B0R2_9BILA